MSCITLLLGLMFLLMTYLMGLSLMKSNQSNFHMFTPNEARTERVIRDTIVRNYFCLVN